MAWQVQAAKQRFSELIERTLSEGPQTVTRRGRPVVVMVEAEAFRRLSGAAPDLKRYLLEGPDFEGLELERSGDVGRPVVL